jgi:hypothetical protein
VVGANVHAGVLHEFLTAPDQVYDGRLPEHAGLRCLYRDLRAGLEWYLREGCPEMLWWVEPEPRTPNL